MLRNTVLLVPVGCRLILSLPWPVLLLMLVTSLLSCYSTATGNSS